MDEKQEKKFIRECKSWKNTKWRHSVAVKGSGVDCVQFMIAVAREMGWIDKKFKIAPYPRDWALHQSRSMLMEGLEKFCVKVNVHFLEIGDILVYEQGRCNSHVAYYIGENKAMHSHIQYGVVEYNIYEPKVRKKLSCAMRWGGNK